MALLTFGEGWHNNHHRYPLSARQGMYWWGGLHLLSPLPVGAHRVVWDLKVYPEKYTRKRLQSYIFTLNDESLGHSNGIRVLVCQLCLLSGFTNE